MKTIQVADHDGNMTVDAVLYGVYGQLAVTRVIRPDKTRNKLRCAVTHLPTGGEVRLFDTVDKARKAARAWRGFGFWSETDVKKLVTKENAEFLIATPEWRF